MHTFYFVGVYIAIQTLNARIPIAPLRTEPPTQCTPQIFFRQTLLHDNQPCPRSLHGVPVICDRSAPCLRPTYLPTSTGIHTWIICVANCSLFTTQEIVKGAVSLDFVDPFLRDYATVDLRACRDHELILLSLFVFSVVSVSNVVACTK